MAKPIDATSLVIAGGIGALLAILIRPLWKDCAVDCQGNPYIFPMTGFAIGAGVQAGLRLTEVS